MIDLPAAASGLQQINLGSLSAAIEDYGPVIEVVRKTWDKESLRDILNGHLAVPDQVINEAISKKVASMEDSPVKSLSIASKENGRLAINADTNKLGRIELSGTVDAFVHDASHSYMTYTLKERELKDHGFMSWIFSRISLSMAEKIVGPIELSDDLPTTIHGNTITVDFNDLLRSSELGQTTIRGYNLLDVVHIDGAVPHEGYVEFATSVDLPENVRSMLLNIL